MQLFPRTRTWHRAESRPVRNESPAPDIAPMSRARLLAEEAFSMPPAPAPVVSSPLIIVRKARLGTRTSLLPASQDLAPGESEPAGKDPRVFRISAAGQDSGIDERHEGQGLSAHEPAGMSDSRVPNAEPPRRRLAADKRPGPVVQLYQAPSDPRADAAVAQAQGQGGSSLAGLTRALAELDPVFQAIAYAQSFQAVDESDRGAWSEIARAADEIDRDIKLVLRHEG